MTKENILTLFIFACLSNLITFCYLFADTSGIPVIQSGSLQMALIILLETFVMQICATQRTVLKYPHFFAKSDIICFYLF